jgi:hypothetical protein
LSTTPAPAEWLTAAASSVDLAKLTNAGAIALLNDIRKGPEVPPPLQSTSTSTSTDVRVTTVVDAPSKASATTVQPSLSPTDLSSTQQKPRSLDTKEKFLVCFHEIYQVRSAFVPHIGLSSLMILSFPASGRGQGCGFLPKKSVGSASGVAAGTDEVSNSSAAR